MEIPDQGRIFSKKPEKRKAMIHNCPNCIYNDVLAPVPVPCPYWEEGGCKKYQPREQAEVREKKE